MIIKNWSRRLTVLVGIMGLIACGSNAENATQEQSVTEKSEEVVKKPKLDVPKTDTRFRVDSNIAGKDVLLILNREDVPTDELTDFYLKIEGINPDDVVISTETKQGLVSKNKEKYYFGVKGVEGAKKIDLQILIDDESGNRSALGTISIPVESKK